MQQLSRLVELFENPATDRGNTRQALEPPAFKIKSVAPASWQDALGHIVETHIIPRLFLSNLAQHQTVRPPAILHPDLGVFIKLLLKSDTLSALTYVRRLEDQGTPLERILLDLLGGASRYLGALWESDHCDFIEVIDGLHRLHHILQTISPVDDDTTPGGRRAMFLTAPCETHDFGVAVVDRFFRASGWQTKRCLEQDHIVALQDEHYEIVGFSLSCDRYFEGLTEAVKRARQMSKNASIKVLVGGAVFLKNPELVEIAGADGMATDAPSAVMMAEALLNDCAFV